MSVWLEGASAHSPETLRSRTAASREDSGPENNSGTVEKTDSDSVTFREDLRDMEVAKWQGNPRLLETSKVIEEMEGYNLVSCNACLFYNSPIGCAKGEDCFFCHHSPEMVGGDRPRKEHRESVKKAVQGYLQKMRQDMRQSPEVHFGLQAEAQKDKWTRKYCTGRLDAFWSEVGPPEGEAAGFKMLFSCTTELPEGEGEQFLLTRLGMDRTVLSIKQRVKLNLNIIAKMACFLKSTLSSVTLPTLTLWKVLCM